MRNYIQRLNERCSKVTFAFWWLLRLVTAYAFVMSLFKRPFDLSAPIQIGLSLVAMFGWEMCMAASEKSFLRIISPVYQSVAVPMLFLTAVCGKYLNLYYVCPWLDVALQFIFGAFAVFVGYEIACALSIRDKYSCTKAMHFYVAFGIGFIAINALELWEFTFDHVIGMITGEPGNAQYWSFALAEGTLREKTFIDSIAPGRWPIMDLMGDIILSTVSAFIALLVINLWPYRLRGKFKYNMDFGDEDSSKKQFETVNGEKK